MPLCENVGNADPFFILARLEGNELGMAKLIGNNENCQLFAV